MALFCNLMVRAVVPRLSRQMSTMSSPLDSRVKENASVNLDCQLPVPTKKERTFEELLENSRLLTSCGDSPVNQRVIGEVIAVVGDDLYIDFGGKFHGVVPRPTVEQDGQYYVKGTPVEVIVKDLEITGHFLGASRNTSLLEADISLVTKRVRPKEEDPLN